MTPEQQRIAIAEACGWRTLKIVPTLSGKILAGDHPGLIEGDRNFPLEGNTYGAPVPDYLNDLNAMHASLRLQTQAFRAEFDRLLHAIAEEKHLLVTELEVEDWSECFISCLQSQCNSGNSTP